MRLLGRLAILLALLALAVPLARQLTLLNLPERPVQGVPAERLKQASSAIVYRLRPDVWLDFELPATGEPFYRVLSNAEIRPGADERLAPWRYAIEYRLLDARGEVLETHVYHHRTRISRLAEEDGRPGEPLAFYLDGDEIPADGRIMLVRALEFPGATRLQLRLHRAGPPVQGVVVRVYQRERIPDHKLVHGWNRIDENKKARLARGNVYGKEWLSPREQLALLRYRWVPLAPRGITGDDGIRRVLYQQEGAESVPHREAVLPEGLLVEPGHHGTLPVPPSGGELRFEVHRVEAGKGGTLLLRWRGESDRSRFERRVALADLEAGRRLSLPGAGLLDIASDRAVVLRAELRLADGGTLDITPATAFLRAWRAAPDQWVDFRITHLGKRRTPLRIDYRALLTSADSQALELRYRLLDARGRSIWENSCRGEAVASLYDRLYEERPPYTGVSDALHCYLHVSPRVARVRVELSAPGLVHAYTVPPDLVTRQTLPRDRYSYDPEGLRLPAWYGIAPADKQRLIRELRLERLVWQHRPPEDDPELLAGRYLWEEFHPRGNWRARHLLNPRDTLLPLPDDALGAVYHELGEGETKVTLVAEPGRRGVRARLIWLRERGEPLRVRILLDGRPLLERTLRGRRGEFRLPEVPAGPHRLRIEASQPVRWFMNRLRSDGPTWVRRLAVRVDRRPQTFVYRKRQREEVLTGQLQLPWEHRDPVRLRVRIEGPRRRGVIGSDGWSLTDREFLIHPDRSARIPVLGSRKETVDKGQRFHIPLRSDLAAGEYRVRVWLEEAQGHAYLSLYRLTPGLHERRRLFREAGAEGLPARTLQGAAADIETERASGDQDEE